MVFGIFFLQGLIVDQTIEKVSFCAPDRSHEKGFSYICRDGLTRRWMCHGFVALKESVSARNVCTFSLVHKKAQWMLVIDSFQH